MSINSGQHQSQISLMSIFTAQVAEMVTTAFATLLPSFIVSQVPSIAESLRLS
jgi:hypothetical protein